jgi:3',5'-cyclic AMP phosphodiesterase CpdA
MSLEPTFVHLSDLHIGPPGQPQYGTDTAQNLRDVAARIAEMRLDPAAIVLSGDLANHGEPEAYEHLRGIMAESFEPLGAPVLMNLGNHDLRAPFRQVFHGIETHEGEHWYYSQDCSGIRFIMLDSKIPDRVYGELGRQQLDWLDAELQQPAAVGHVVVLHHPSIPRGVHRPDDYLLLDRADFAEVIQRHQVLGILCGHSHVATAAVFAGTLHLAAPATAYLLDPSIRDGGRGLEGCGFTICTVREGRLVANPVILPGLQRELYRHWLPASVTAEAVALR